MKQTILLTAFIISALIAQSQSIKLFDLQEQKSVYATSSATIRLGKSNDSISYPYTREFVFKSPDPNKAIILCATQLTSRITVQAQCDNNEKKQVYSYNGCRGEESISLSISIDEQFKFTDSDLYICIYLIDKSEGKYPVLASRVHISSLYDNRNIQYDSIVWGYEYRFSYIQYQLCTSEGGPNQDFYGSPYVNISSNYIYSTAKIDDKYELGKNYITLRLNPSFYPELKDLDEPLYRYDSIYIVEPYSNYIINRNSVQEIQYLDIGNKPDRSRRYSASNGKFHVQYYLSEDSIYDNLDILLDGVNKIPYDTEAGNYYQIAIVDPFHQDQSVNHSRNIAIERIYVPGYTGFNFAITNVDQQNRQIFFDKSHNTSTISMDLKYSADNLQNTGDIQLTYFLSDNNVLEPQNDLLLVTDTIICSQILGSYSSEISFPIDLSTPKEQYIIVRALPSNYSKETDSTDNLFVSKIDNPYMAPKFILTECQNLTIDGIQYEDVLVDEISYTESIYYSKDSILDSNDIEVYSKKKRFDYHYNSTTFSNASELFFSIEDTLPSGKYYKIGVFTPEINPALSAMFIEPQYHVGQEDQYDFNLLTENVDTILTCNATLAIDKDYKNKIWVGPDVSDKHIFISRGYDVSYSGSSYDELEPGNHFNFGAPNEIISVGISTEFGYKTDAYLTVSCIDSILPKDIGVSGIDFYDKNPNKFTVNFYCSGFYSEDENIQGVGYSIFFSTDSILDSADAVFKKDRLRYLRGGAIERECKEKEFSDTVPRWLDYIIIEVDTQHEIEEADEENIFVIKPYKEIEYYDGAIYATERAALQQKPIEHVYFQLNHLNQHEDLKYDYSLFFSTDRRIDSTGILLKNIDPIVPWGTKPGEYYFIWQQVCVSKHIVDTTTWNDICILPVEVLKVKYDCALQDFELKLNNVGEGEPIKYDLSLINYYDPLETDLKFFLSKDSIYDPSDSLVFYKDIKLLSHDTTTTYNRESYYISTDSLPHGDFYLIAMLNADQSFTETSYSNNYQVAPIKIQEQKSELVIDSVRFSSNLIPGKRDHKMSIFFNNEGNIESDNLAFQIFLSTDSTYSDDDIQIFSDCKYYISNCPPFSPKKNTEQFYIEERIPAGLEYLLIKMLPNSQYNAVRDTFYVCSVDIEYQDIAITHFSVPSDTIYTGTNLSEFVNLEISDLNNSYRTITDAYFRISTDTVFSSDKIISWNVKTAGDYYLFANATFSGVDENLTNNHAYVPIYIGETMHAIQTDSSEIITTELGQKAELSIKLGIKNSSNGLYRLSLPKTYISEDSILDKDDVLVGEHSEGWNDHVYPDYYRNNVLFEGFRWLYANDRAFFSTRYFMPSICDTNTYYIISSIVGITLPEERKDTLHYVIPFNFKPYPYDTKLSNFKVDNTEVTSGDAVLVHYTMEQLYSDCYIEFTMSKDNDINTTEDNYYSGSKHYKYDYHTSISDSVFVTIPTNIEAGNYYFFASLTVKNNKEKYESDKENNVASKKVKINTTETDLLVWESNLHDQKFTANTPIKFDAIIVNIGTFNAPSFCSGLFISTDTILSNDDILIDTVRNKYGLRYANSFNMETTFSIDNSLPYGNYFLIIKTDSKNESLEKDETNNTQAIPFSLVPPSSDIVANPVVAYGGAVGKGQENDLHVTVSNNGSVTTNSYEIVHYLSEDAILDKKSDILLDSIYIRKGVRFFSEDKFTNTVHFPSNLNTGEYFIITELRHQTVKEGESVQNNTAISPITIQDNGPDLCIQDSINGMLKGYIGIGMEVETYIQNIGNQNAQESTVSYHLSMDNKYDAKDTYLTSEDVDLLSPNIYSYEQSFVKTSNQLLEGKYYVIVTADSKNTIDEVNEKNNQLALPVNFITPGPDFVSVRIKTENYVTVISPQRTINLALHYNNQGYYRGVYPMLVSFYLSENVSVDIKDQLLATYDFNFPDIPKGPLKSDAETSKIFSLELPEKLLSNGRYILVVLDADNSFEEEDETNNVISLPIILTSDGGGYIPSDPVKTTVQENNQGVIISPNPATDQITIQNPTNTIYRYRFTTVTGVSLLQGQVSEYSNKTINIKSIPAGIYYVETNNANYVQSFIIEIQH